MASERKFYKHTVTVEVLSEDEYSFDSLDGVAYAISRGDCSGKWEQKVEKIDGPTAAKLLIEQGSDPGFFQLDDNGNDIDS